MTTRYKTIEPEGSTLYICKSGERFRLGEVQTVIELYEECHKVPILGGGSCPVKKQRYARIVCEGVVKAFDNGARYEMQADILTPSGVCRRVYLDNLTPIEIDEVDGVWIFETIAQAVEGARHGTR